MSSATRFSADIRNGSFDEELAAVYETELDDQRNRLADLVETFARHFEGDHLMLFSAPGRTELGGNHTDHNGGRVLAAGVTLDTVAVVTPRPHRIVRMVSEGFGGIIEVDLSSTDPEASEQGAPASLIRGVAAFLESSGYVLGGFDAAVSSRVEPGSGLSSSASFEVLIATIVSFLYNDGHLTPVQIAQAGRHAENHFFGKPSGLMDQIACAAGGVVAIDFEDDTNPLVERMKVSFQNEGYQLFAVHTGESHVDLTDDYASVVTEMHSVASALGVERLREISYERFRAKLPELRGRVDDRALLRAVHFFWENARVPRQGRMLKDGDLHGFLAEVRESGSSSWRLLQNCYPPSASAHQGIALALTLSEEFLSRPDLFPHPPRTEGATRVHGGGFAGTIQTYVPVARASAYRTAMSEVFGERSITPLSLRDVGACMLARYRPSG